MDIHNPYLQLCEERVKHKSVSVRVCVRFVAENNRRKLWAAWKTQMRASLEWS